MALPVAVLAALKALGATARSPAGKKVISSFRNSSSSGTGTATRGATRNRIYDKQVKSYKQKEASKNKIMKNMKKKKAKIYDSQIANLKQQGKPKAAKMAKNMKKKDAETYKAHVKLSKRNKAGVVKAAKNMKNKDNLRMDAIRKRK